MAIENANLFQRVAEERRRLEATLVETADAVVLTDRAGKIILVNKAAAQSFRINADMAAGRMADEIFFGHPLGGLLVGQEISLPTTMEVTTPTESPMLTLITCTEWDAASRAYLKRLIVRAELFEQHDIGG